MKEKILLTPVIASESVIIQFTDSIKLTKNVFIKVPGLFKAHIYIDEKPISRIDETPEIKLLDKLGKTYKNKNIMIAFIRTNALQKLSWGLGNINVKNSKLDEAYRVGANGLYYLSLKDPNKLISSFGTISNIDIEMIHEKTRDIFKTIGTPIISKYFNEKNISVFEIDSYSDDIKKEIFEGINNSNFINNLGFELKEIFVNPIHVNDEDIEMIRSNINRRNVDNSEINNEIKKLQSAIALLDNSDSIESLIENVDELRASIDEIKDKHMEFDLIKVYDKINDLNDKLEEKPEFDKDEIDELKEKLDELADKTMNQTEYIKKLEDELNNIKKDNSNAVSSVQSILENQIEELKNNTIPVPENLKPEVIEKITTNALDLIEASKTDEDFVIPASAIYHNLEKNFHEKLLNKNDKYYMTLKDFKTTSDIYATHGEPFFKDSYRTHSTIVDGDKCVEMPSEFRFYKLGMSVDDSLEAAKCWTTLNRIRHFSGENNKEKVEKDLKIRGQSRKEFLKYVLNFYKKNGIYNKD